MQEANRLINESSPYLLQHAHNPVNWYPWGEEALTLAKTKDKPILISIGYAACHWCHVMERESFEDETTATMMNENFINIKIDREERPDLDHIYMDAVQALTGSGGWPLNVFLTPDAKPFYGGTYFPPQKAYNRPSWQDTLLAVASTFKERRHEIEAQAENLTGHLLTASALGMKNSSEEQPTNFSDAVHEIFRNIMKQADREWGGFGRAPKFPQSFTINYLFRYYHVTGNKEALQQAILSLDKMIEGGIYDHIGGGFARYATDTEWLVPHFEKMLYDNALLVSLLSEAYLLTRKEIYKVVIHETMDFLKREMRHTSNGFYAALDADSEGVEGKFYVWEFEEVKRLLGRDAVVFCEYYDISSKGNWEGKNIPHTKQAAEKFAIEKNIPFEKLNKIIKDGKRKLLTERGKRVRPQLDDKIILGWNALMNTACCKAFAATGKNEYREMAIDNMRFLLENFSKNNEQGFYHTWKEGVAKYPAFLDDYAFLIGAFLNLQEVTGNKEWLEKAIQVTHMVIKNFREEETGLFFYTPVGQKDVIIRKKEVYDGAVPSGNAEMAYHLFHLSIITGNKEWEKQATRMLSAMEKLITRYPPSFGLWACILLEMAAGANEIAVLYDKHEELQTEILNHYIPHKVMMASLAEDPIYPLLAGKGEISKPTIYLCRNYTCQPPVFSAKELMKLINKAEKTINLKLIQ